MIRLALLLLLRATPANGCEQNLTATFVCTSVEVPGGSDSPPPPAGGGPLIVYSPVPVTRGFCFGPPEGPFEYTGIARSELERDEPIGISWGYQPINAATGQPVGDVVETCSLAAAPPQPPPAPTAAELWAASPLPTPVVAASPPGQGLVGVATWFWSDLPATPVTATVTLRGWTATVTATPTAWSWDAGDGTDRLSAPSPGTSTNPAATHAYTAHGTYTVTHSVTWTGRLTLTGYGVTMVDQGLGTVTSSATTAYPVQQRQAVLVG